MKPDKYVSQGGLRKTQVAGVYPAYSKSALAEGVVVAIRYIDDDRNLSKKYTEYDVRDLRTGQIYTNCRRLHAMAGQDDGDDDILRPAQKIEASPGFVFDARTSPLSNSDGDRVVVGFLGAAHSSAVILGVTPQRLTGYAAVRSDGRRRLTTHKGTSVEFKDDGAWVLTRNVDESRRTTLTFTPEGNIIFEQHDGARLHLDTAVTKLDSQEVAGILLGFAAEEQVIRGNAFKATYDAFVALYNAFVSIYNSHFHLDSNGLPTSAPTGVPIPNPAFNPIDPPGPSNPMFLPSPGTNATATGEMPVSDLSVKVRTE